MVRHRVTVRFLIGEVWQKMSGMGRENGVWVEVWELSASVYRKPSVDVERVRELKESGMGASAIAKELGIGRASVYRAKGRKPSVDVEKVREVKESGMGASAIAKELGIGRASVYRALQG